MVFDSSRDMVSARFQGLHGLLDLGFVAYGLVSLLVPSRMLGLWNVLWAKEHFKALGARFFFFWGGRERPGGGGGRGGGRGKSGPCFGGK